MTLGEGKAKVYKLIDEYSSGGAVTKDADIEHKMADFFDMAQKDVAQVQPIVKLRTLEPEEGTAVYAVPEDFAGLHRIWINGRESRGAVRWKGGNLLIGGSPESVELEYFAFPETISGDTPDSWKFQVREDAAQAMCYYVAAQQLFVDLVTDYDALYQEYLRRLGNLNGQVWGAQDAVCNTLWR